MIAKCVRFLFLCFAALPWFWWQLFAPLIGKTKAFQGMSQFCSFFPGKLGELFRAAFYRLSFKHTSQRTSIAFLTTFSDPRTHIDEHVSIGAYCNIGWAHIGRDCIISSHVCITSGKNDHSFTDLTIPIRLQEGTGTKVSIGADCWIGANVTIMESVGEGSVIAAGSVVTKPIPPYSIVAGVPAKIIGSRISDEEREKLNLQTHKAAQPTVLQLITTLNMGGAERLAISILEKEKEHFSGVVGAMYGESGDLAKLAESLHIPTFNLQAGSCGRIQTIWRLYKMLRQHNVDIVHTHAAYLLNFAVPAAKLAGIPVIFTEHSVFDLQEMASLRRTIKWTAPFLDGISCISQPIADYLSKDLGIDARRIHIIENGIDIEQFAPKSATNTAAELPWKETLDPQSQKPLFIFGTVARLCMEKDHPTMLRAFAHVHKKYPETRLLMVGDGAERQKTQNLIDELHLTDFVHITGKSLDIAEKLRSLDIFVMSSQHEGLPMAILEAMACNIPVISTTAGNIAALNDTGEHILLVPIKNPETLAQAMEKMYTNEELRKKFADKAHTFIVQSKSAQIMADAYYTVFKNAGLSA